MPRFEVKQSAHLDLVSHAGLVLIGQCCEAAQIETVIDSRFPVSHGMKTSDYIKAMIALLSLGKSDFEAIEQFRHDRFFKEVLRINKVPSSSWMRQQLDAKALELRAAVDELSVRLLERTEAPITAHEGFIRLEIDTFVMDNSNTKKEEVGRTYQGVDGYCPISGYLGNEGWNVGLELRAGTQHSSAETEHFYERVFPRVKRLVKATQAVLMVEDSGFDSARLLFSKAQERDRWATEGRRLEIICKWNPRKQDKASWVAAAEEAGVFEEIRPGKRVGQLNLKVERAWKGEKRIFRLIVEVTERTIDKKGQLLLVPEIKLQGWWTSLDLPAQDVIKHYQYHGTHEQFHSEIKSDLDLERLPSGKFNTNDAILRLGAFVYNCLCLLGPWGLTG